MDKHGNKLREKEAVGVLQDQTNSSLNSSLYTKTKRSEDDVQKQIDVF